MKKLQLTPLAGMLGTTFAVTLTASPLVNAGVNPFSMNDLGSGYMVAEGEGKCGEGKCGDKKAEEGTCGAKKAEEGKCGEGKCGENKKTEEGKCGEGKCGANK